MGVFEHFPYVNFHELNFSWVIAKIKELEDVIGTQIVDIVARAGVAANTQAIQDLTTTVTNNATTAHNESQTALNAANAAQSDATTANNKADANTTKIANALTCSVIFDQKSIPQSPTQYACDWHLYDFIIVEAVQYGNKRSDLFLPYDYFRTTSSGNLARLFDPIAECQYGIFQDNTGYIKVVSTQTDAALGVVIYGLSLK